HLSDQVILKGVLKPAEIQEEMLHAIAFVQHSVIALTGDSEGTPVGIMEAQAAALPVISTMHAGIPDVVIHNECFADTKTPEYIRKITTAHYAGVPAVVIHCAMHTYRSTDINDWREFLGVTSRRHDHQSRYPVTKVDSKHSILKGMPATWTTPMDELYVIEKIWPNAKALATSVSEQDGKTYPVAWTNKYGKAKVFGTTFGHSDATFKDPVFLNLVSRGILWAAGRLK
ncbi:MAG: glycosyltransferase, partial [Chitinophagaceae bacterium]